MLLRKLSSNRPRTENKLLNYLVAHLGNGVGADEIAALIKDLGRAGHLFIDEIGRVTYHRELQ